MLDSLQKVSSLLQYMNDSEHLFVMDLVVLFYQRQGFAVESYQVPLLFSFWSVFILTRYVTIVTMW